MAANSGTIWSGDRPKAWNIRGAPAACSDSSRRNSSSAPVLHLTGAVSSQRISISGALRFSSIAAAAASAATAQAMRMPVQLASVHQ